MAKIRFDSGGMVADPTLVLMTKSGKRLGLLIGVENVHYARHMNSANEISFRIHKTVDGVDNPLWEHAVDFKVVWYREVNECFEISVETDESDETVKNVSGKALAESELSQVMLFDMEVNTEADIARDDYAPTVFYDSQNPGNSLLDRILNKAPHYTIHNVQQSLCAVQRTFSFDNKSIPDALSEVAEEIGCIIIYGSGVDENGDIVREINAYDLMNRCTSCYKRFEGNVCPDCGSTSYYEGYGNNTGIVVARDNLADSINYSSDTGSVKNCFRLVGGDDEMTAAIRSCNPNGSSYIWNITDDMKEDMSDELVEKLEDYDELYEQYATTEEFTIDSTDYNAVVDKYLSSKSDLKYIFSGSHASSSNAICLKGTPSLVDAEYSILDLSSWLKTSMMPTYQYTVPTAAAQCSTIQANLTTVAVTNLNTASAQTVALAIKSLAKLYAHTEVYKVEVNTTSYSKPTWTGTVTLTNYSDEADTATTGTMTVTATSSDTTYMTQLVQKKVDEYGETKYDITGLFGLELAQFENALTEYSLDCLESFDECCRACLSVLVDQGAGASTSSTYSIYKGYWDKLQAIEAEMATRERELEVVGVFSEKNGLLQTVINIINGVHDDLNFENYVGTTLWKEFVAYRREQEYTNSNYCSNGLNNAELIANAKQFYEAAQTELYKSSTLQHSISASLANLIVMEEFEGLTDNFDVGNWLYVIADEKPYKLRLVSFEIDFSDIQKIDVDFSDLLAIRNGVSDLRSVIDSARSMATSYGAVARQAGSGGDAGKKIAKIYADGLDATKVAIMSNANNQDMQFNDSGLLGRRWIDEFGDYSPEQCMLINNGLAFTDDGWQTVKTALGKIVVDGQPRYGLIGDVIVGNLGQFVTLEADKIVGGILTDSVGNNYWNLDTGEFSLMAGSISPNTVISDESGEATTMSDVIVSVDVLYAKNQSTTTAPTTGWSTTAPQWESGYYIWQKTATTNLYGDITESEPTCIQGAKGDTGDTGGTGATGNGVSAIEEQYYLSTSNTTQTGGSWSTSQPAWSSGKYIWTRSHITWTDNTTTDTDPVLAQAINGANSTANSAQTTANNAASAVTTLDNSLDTVGVFNRLTNNGTQQCIKMDSSGNLYINATYIKSGTLDASQITVSNLSASSINTGGMSAARINSGTMSAARIQGGTLKLGGASNGNGLLEVYNASNTKTGSWDNSGINIVGKLGVYNGTFSTFGGSVGYLSGLGDDGTTNGIGLIGSGSRNYFIATTDGARMTNTKTNDSTRRASIFAASGDVSINAYKYSGGSETYTAGQIRANCNSFVLNYGSFTVANGGQKSRAVDTESYRSRLLYAYETPTPMFGDVGGGVLDENGECVVEIDDIFAESVNLDVNYYVFLQKEGPGDIWVSAKERTYFVASGTPGLKFSWELKAVQLGFEFTRIEEFEMPEEGDEEEMQEIMPEDIAPEYYEELYDGEISDFEAIYEDELAS